MSCWVISDQVEAVRKPSDVRYAPKSDHIRESREMKRSVISGLMHRSKGEEKKPYQQHPPYGTGRAGGGAVYSINSGR